MRILICLKVTMSFRPLTSRMAPDLFHLKSSRNWILIGPSLLIAFAELAVVVAFPRPKVLAHDYGIDFDNVPCFQAAKREENLKLVKVWDATKGSALVFSSPLWPGHFSLSSMLFQGDYGR